MSSKKLDRTAAMERTLGAAKAEARSRFDIADDVMGTHPSTQTSPAKATPIAGITSAKPGQHSPAREASAATTIRPPIAGGLTIDQESGLEMILSTDDLSYAQAGKIYLVALILVITDSKNNARVYYQNEDLDKTSTSMSESGQDVAAVGYVNEQRKMIALIDGQMRARGMISAGGHMIRLEIRKAPTSAREEYKMSRRINEIRSSQTALDDAVRWEQLLEAKEYANAAELAVDMGKSEAYVSQIRSINKIPQQLILKMKDHKITSSKAIACAIATIFARDQQSETPDPEHALAIAKEIVEVTIERGLTREQVEALIQAKEKGPVTRARGLARPFSYGGVQGRLNVYPGKGELKLDIKGLSEPDLEKLRSRIEEVISGQQQP